MGSKIGFEMSLIIVEAMCEFHDSIGNGFGDIWWTDNPIYFSSIDVYQRYTLISLYPTASHYIIGLIIIYNTILRDLVNIKKIKKSKKSLDTIDPTHPPLYPKKNLENFKSN